MGTLKERGEIPANYKVIETLSSSITPGLVSATADDPTMVSTTATAEVLDIMSTDPSPTTADRSAHFTGSTKSINSDNFLWIVNRFSKRATHESDYVPGFTAVRSTTVNRNFHPTTTILAPILPYPATTYDTVLTTIINFQDALKQKGDTYGALWADEGVYRIAKEIQLMKPDQFNNVFLGCLGAYLEPSGIFVVLVETECYGTDVIKTVVSGSHSSRARTAHSMTHKVLTSMMLEAFLSKFPERQMELEALQVDFKSKELTSEEWNTMKEHGATIQAIFQVYLKERASLSQSFR